MRFGSGTPTGVDDLWAMMGMKKFSILEPSKEEESPDLGKSYLNGPIDVLLECVPADDGVHVRIILSIRPPEAVECA